MRVNPIRNRAHPAELDVARFDVEATANEDETNDCSAHIAKFDRFKYNIDPFICNL